MVRFEVRLGPDDAGALDPGCGSDSGNPVDQQQGRCRQTHLSGILVLRLEFGPEEIGHESPCGLLDLGIVPAGPDGRPRQQWLCSGNDFPGGWQRPVCRRRRERDRRFICGGPAACGIGDIGKPRCDRHPAGQRQARHRGRGVRHVAGQRPGRRTWHPIAARDLQRFGHGGHPDRAPVRKQEGGEFRDLGEVCRLDPVGGDGLVCLALQNAPQCRGQRVSRPQLHEGPDAVFPRLFYCRRKIDRVDRLPREHVSCRLAGRFIGRIDGVGIEPNTGPFMHFAGVQLPPCLGERLHRPGMNDQVLVHLGTTARPERFADLAAGLCRTANHAIGFRIDDGHLDPGMTGDFRLHGFDRRLNPPIGPVRRHVPTPGGLRRFELTANMPFIHGGIGDFVQQRAGIAPEPESEQGVAFTQRQPQRGIRLEAENV